MLPAIFVSHGAPSLPFDDVPARDFLRGLGKTLSRPKAIVAVSAHWDTDAPETSAPPANDTIHDFRGFPRALYEIEYPAPSDGLLAREIGGLLNGFAARTTVCGGWITAPGCR
jgi:4,5-DOPA dioxygenase extradiol